MRCDDTPIISSTCLQHFHRTCSRFTRSQKGIQGFVCFFCSWDAAAHFYHLWRPSPVPAYWHAVVYSATQTFDLTSIPLCVNSVPTSHTGCALAYPVVWPTPPGCAPLALYQLPPSLPNPWWLWLTTPMHQLRYHRPLTQTVLSPNHTVINPLLHHCSCSCRLRKLNLPLYSNLKCPACSKTLAKPRKPCLVGLQARLSYEMHTRNTLNSWTTAWAERLALSFMQLLVPSAVAPISPHEQSHVAPRLTLHQLCVLQWSCDSLPTKFLSLPTSWSATEFMWRWSRKHSSARRTPALPSTLYVGTMILAAQYTTG